MKKLLIAILFVLVTVSGFCAGTTTETSGKDVFASRFFSNSSLVATRTTNIADMGVTNTPTRFAYNVGINGSGISTITTDISAGGDASLAFYAASYSNVAKTYHHGVVLERSTGVAAIYIYPINSAGTVTVSNIGGVYTFVFSIPGATAGDVYLWVTKN